MQGRVSSGESLHLIVHSVSFARYQLRAQKRMHTNWSSKCNRCLELILELIKCFFCCRCMSREKSETRRKLVFLFLLLTQRASTRLMRASATIYSWRRATLRSPIARNTCTSIVQFTSLQQQLQNAWNTAAALARIPILVTIDGCAYTCIHVCGMPKKITLAHMYWPNNQNGSTIFVQVIGLRMYRIHVSNALRAKFFSINSSIATRQTSFSSVRSIANKSKKYQKYGIQS